MNQNAIQPAITFLNLSGDISITWDASNEAAIIKLVEQKMKEGFTFFILKPRFFGLLGQKKVVAQSIEAVAEAGMAIVADADFDKVMLKLHDTAVEAVVSTGEARLVQPDNTVELDTVRRAKSAQEVVQNQSVGIRRVVGG